VRDKRSTDASPQVTTRQPRDRPASTDGVEAAGRRRREEVRGPPPRCVDKQGAADYLGGVGLNTIERLINTGALPIVKLPVQNTRHGLVADGTSRRVLIDVRDLDALIERNKETRGEADVLAARLGNVDAVK
jgi:hypothetical protein